MCEYDFGVLGKAKHLCRRRKGHPSRHVCACGSLHDARADYNGRWAGTKENPFGGYGRLAKPD